MSNVIPLPARDDHTPPHRVNPTRPAGRTTPEPLARAVWTVKETAHLLSLSLNSTYALIRDGEIPAVKVGGRWLVPKRRFQQWINNLPPGDPDDIDEADWDL